MFLWTREPENSERRDGRIHHHVSWPHVWRKCRCLGHVTVMTGVTRAIPLRAILDSLQRLDPQEEWKNIISNKTKCQFCNWLIKAVFQERHHALDVICMVMRCVDVQLNASLLWFSHSMAFVPHRNPKRQLLNTSAHLVPGKQTDKRTITICT